MTPTKFPESNMVLTAPKGMDNCGALPVHTDGEMCVSLWTASWRERLGLLLHGRLWVFVWSGRTQPPIGLSIDKTVFVKPSA